MDPEVYNKSNKLEKDKYHRISLICVMLKKKKKKNLIDTENRFVVSRGERGWRVGKMGEGGQIYDDEW